jgi:hypothetical protein
LRQVLNNGIYSSWPQSAPDLADIARYSGFPPHLTNISILPIFPHFQNPKNLAILYAQEKRKTVQ